MIPSPRLIAARHGRPDFGHESRTAVGTGEEAVDDLQERAAFVLGELTDLQGLGGVDRRPLR